MRREPANQLNTRALIVWRISAAISMVILLLMSVAIFIASIIFDWPLWIGLSLMAIVVVISVISVGLYPRLQWKRWKYEVHESEIDLQHGVFVVRRTLIPMVRVQHVDTQQGPLLRKFKLASVTISTAATVHEIPAVDEEEAEILRDKISKLARVVDEHE
ncbi:membrane protein YdbS with pleckstrin-like domain [Bacillus mesophilus]|uniref:PH domain-containing protein n=1 Tax=Bacillus mesophilus TaxID=1808955 RepID=A0A6M0QC03_9BACI|nr:PH domain-containing protein [Bacillus mesophilus]MBM7663141.1 membrane protein YdbS with pleckstrin-like domain [Bacillus mesophilus]NEY73883.1 PH domain-containing protein [Bacillus mesophilus]